MTHIIYPDLFMSPSMSKTQRPLSPYAADALHLLGQLLRKSRIEKRMTTTEVAVRSGISRGLLHRIESGDPGCTIGAVFEVAAIVGLPLFDAKRSTLGQALETNREVMRLLPRSIRHQRTEVNDDF
jgi:transcriptional regulator with XRE-family HTH domain